MTGIQIIATIIALAAAAAAIVGLVVSLDLGRGDPRPVAPRPSPPAGSEAMPSPDVASARVPVRETSAVRDWEAASVVSRTADPVGASDTEGAHRRCTACLDVVIRAVLTPDCCVVVLNDTPDAGGRYDIVGTHKGYPYARTVDPADAIRPTYRRHDCLGGVAL